MENLEATSLKKVHSGPYFSDYWLLKDGGIFLSRVQPQSKARDVFDAFGDFWSLAMADIPPRSLSVVSRGQLYPLEGSCAVLLPPFSLINWRFLRPFELQWKALIYRSPYPTDFPQQACFFKLPTEERPHNLTELNKILRQERPLTRIDKIEELNPLATKLKRAIDLHFTEDKSLKEYAADLHISSDVLTRYFKNCYSLTPIEYRKQLRLLWSMMRLLFDSVDVTEVSSEAGYRNLKNFNKQFAKHIAVKPSLLKKGKA